MHINRTNLVIVVGGVVVDSLVGIATGGVKCDFILSVCNLTTTSLLVNRTENVENWFTLSLSLSPETEFSFVNATFANGMRMKGRPAVRLHPFHGCMW